MKDKWGKGIPEYTDEDIMTESELLDFAMQNVKQFELDKNPETIKKWNAGKIPLLFAHPASAGHGLNLQDGGHILVFFSHWWDLEQYQQIIERIGPTRQAQAGHPRAVFLYHIVARDTVDELVMLRRETKKEVQDILLDALKKSG